MTFNLDEHTGVLIKKAARLFERVANMNLAELGVTYSQTIFLVRLWEKDGQTQTELTKSSGLKQPTVVRILDRMERDKLIKRIVNDSDKRSYHFFLTARAKDACRKLEKQGVFIQSIAMRKFKTSEINQINNQLLEVIKNLQFFIDNNLN
jgi:MarR family transcriptional regulator, transcriptional regulator for hemolysin